MRSRYSAFARADSAYLLSTWHRTTRPAELSLDVNLQWYRLDIVRTEQGGPFDTEGVVEFVAYYEHPFGSGDLREVSDFVREDGRWFYVDGSGSST